jgi:hypothetical protein
MKIDFNTTSAGHVN